MFLNNLPYITGDLLTRLNIEHTAESHLPHAPATAHAAASPAITLQLTSPNITPLSLLLSHAAQATGTHPVTLTAAPALALRLIQDMSIQITHLQNSGSTFPLLCPEQILVIDDTKFLIVADPALLLPITDHRITVSTTTYDPANPYTPPELRTPSTSELRTPPEPTPEHRTTRTTACYYSIGLLALALLFGSPTPAHLHHPAIKNTKLAQCVNRCIQPNPNHRYLLYL
jgi:hypothetical protein